MALFAPSFAQNTGDDIRKEIEDLKRGQQEIRKQLDEIKALLQARPAAPSAALPATAGIPGKLFDLGSNPIRGGDTAGLTLIEFSDYQ
jgi:hypothetical protein